MAPAQTSVKPDPDNGMQSFVKPAVRMASGSSFGKPSGKVFVGMSNPEDSIIEIEKELDEQVNGSLKVVKEEDSDATEYSSSFDGTLSGAENCSGVSDAEVDSGFLGDNNLSFDDFSNIFPGRKKKLTSQWRNYISPLMWRCKWTELKIKQLQSQAAKYDKELAIYEQRKKLQLDQCIVDGSKSLPCNSQSPVKKVMERKKRQRVEDTADVALFMSQHNLFSYHESKRSDSDGNLVAENTSNPEQNTVVKEEFGLIDGCSLREDKFDQSSLGEILLKIDSVQSRVKKLNSQLEGTIGENSLKLSSSENLNLLLPGEGELQNNSAPSPTFSACNGDTQSLGTLNAPSLHISEYDIAEFVLRESGIPNYGEGLFIPDIIESTANLLSSVDVTLPQQEIGDTCEAIMDNVQIHNQALEMEAHKYTIKTEQEPLYEKQPEPQGSGQESSNPSTLVPALEADTVSKPASHLEQSALTSCLASDINFPKSKRKRGERKAGSGVWNR